MDARKSRLGRVTSNAVKATTLALMLSFTVNSAAKVAQHRRKAIQVYAHRGMRAHMPENIKEAYAPSLAVGTNWVDMDVVFTRDGHVVLGHDPILNPNIVRDKKGQYIAKNSSALAQLKPAKLAAFNQRYAVKNMTRAELLNFDVGQINPDSDYFQYFRDQTAVPGATMPELREVIRHVKEITKGAVGFQIEMKTNPARPDFSADPKKFAKAVYKILREEGIINSTEVQAFDFRCLRELQAINPKIKTAYLTSRDNEPGGVEDFNHADAAIATLWTGGPLVKDAGGSIPQMVSKLGGYAWEPEDAELTPETLAEAHRLGLKVVVWSWPEMSGKAFDPQMVDKMIRWGVDGIITDDPARLNSMLAARGYPTPQNYVCGEGLADISESR